MLEIYAGGYFLGVAVASEDGLDSVILAEVAVAVTSEDRLDWVILVEVAIAVALEDRLDSVILVEEAADEVAPRFLGSLRSAAVGVSFEVTPTSFV